MKADTVLPLSRGTHSSVLAPIIGIVAIGAALRILQFDQSLGGDEMWTYVGATKPNFGGMLDFVRSDEEITPPLFTSLVWLAARVSDSAEVIRLPSLLAGIATIPIVYAIGLRTLGRAVAATAALLTALSPFLIWYSIELRAYGLAVMLVAASTLFLLIAIERRRAVWWVAYGACVCAAMYTHYTASYALFAQFLWAVLAHPEARKPVLLANVGAAVAFLPWIPSLLDDFDAPSQDVIGSLAPFSLGNFADFTSRFAFGSPAVAFRDFIGVWGFVALAVALVVAVAGIVLRRGDENSAQPEPSPRRSVALFVMLAAAAPVGVAVVSLVGDDQFIPRNLATSAPGLMLAIGALLAAGTLATRIVSTGLVVAVFAVGAIRTTESENQRTDYDSAAAFIDRTAGPEDVVLDIIGTNVGGTNGVPLSPPGYTLERALEDPHEVIEAVDVESQASALRDAAGARLFLVGHPFFTEAVRAELLLDGAPVDQLDLTGLSPLRVQVFDVPSRGPGS